MSSQATTPEQPCCETPPRFRWRVIPASLAYIYAFCAAGGLLGGTGITAWTLVVGESFWNRRNPTKWLSLTKWLLLDTLLLATSCYLFYKAGRDWWTQRYRQAIVLSLVALVLFYTSVMVRGFVIFTE